MAILWVTLLTMGNIIICIQTINGEVILTTPIVYSELGVRMQVIETTIGTDILLSCVSQGHNHSWILEPNYPSDLLNEISKEYFEENGLTKSNLKIKNMSYMKIGNFSCTDNFYETRSVIVFVKDPEHPVITAENIITLAGDTEDYICGPTNLHLSVGLHMTSDQDEVDLLPGSKYQQMEVYYDKYRGYKLVNIIDEYMDLECKVGNITVANTMIEIHRHNQAPYPEIKMIPRTPVVGDNITLLCEYEPNLGKKPTVIWELPANNPINEVGRYEINNKTKNDNDFAYTILVIYNARKAFNGNYTCRGYYHGVHNKESSVQLNITDSYFLDMTIITPLNKTDPPEIDLQLGQTQQELKIDVASNPHLEKATWYHDGNEIRTKNNNKSSYHVHFLNDVETLVIRNPKPKHSGLYKFEADNYHFNKTVSIMVNVREFVGVDGPDSVELGSNLTLTCGVPRPSSTGLTLEFCWTLDHETRETCQNNSRLHQTPETYQIILNKTYVRKSDSGLYVCRDNGIEVDHYKLNVKDSRKPEINRVVNSDIFMTRGNSVILTCTATGAPPPTLTWFKDNKLFEHNLYDKNQKLLLVKGIEHTSQFKCVAENFLGKDEFIYTVHATAPEAPVSMVTFSLMIVVVIVLLIAAFIFSHQRVRRYKSEIAELKELATRKNDLSGSGSCLGDGANLITH